MNLIDFFDRSASENPGRVALEYEGVTWSYREVSELAARTSRALQAAGRGKQTRCATISRNHPLAFTAMLGILKAGAVWLPLNPAYSDDENLSLVQFLDAEVLFFHSEQEAFAQRVKQLPQVRQLVCIDRSTVLGPSLDEWTASHPSEALPLPWEPDAVCWLRGTGGTTGRPKGVMNTNRNFETTIANFRSLLRFDKPPVFLAAAPLSHGASVFAMVTLAMAGTVVIQGGFNAQHALRAIPQHCVSLMFLPPTAIYALLAQSNVREFNYSSLRHFVYGAAPISATRLREAMEIFGNTMTQIYGQTEVPTSVAYLGPEDHVDATGAVIEKRLLSCGRPTPFARVALMDDSGAIVPRGQIGEIVVQGGLVMKGYYKNELLTAEVSRYGWHHTGDLAYQDSDGFLYICDRKKDMIVTGGYNVYPSEVEQVLLSHPSVQDCAVVGVPDEKWGEAIKAVIELKPGCDLTADELIAMCKQRIGNFKAPKSVDFVASLPRSPVGKVARNEVRKRYWEGASRNV